MISDNTCIAQMGLQIETQTGLEFFFSIAGLEFMFFIGSFSSRGGCLGSPATDGVCCEWLGDALRRPTDAEVWQLWRRGVLLRLSSGFSYLLNSLNPFSFVDLICYHFRVLVCRARIGGITRKNARG